VAAGLTVVAGYFSVTGMRELFPGAPVAVMVLAATMEGAKLVLAGFLAHQWRELGVVLRLVLAVLTVGLACKRCEEKWHHQVGPRGAPIGYPLEDLRDALR